MSSSSKPRAKRELSLPSFLKWLAPFCEDPHLRLRCDSPGLSVVLGSRHATPYYKFLATSISNFPGDVIVFDPTGKIAAVGDYSSEQRSIVRYNPCNPKMPRFNPLAEVRLGTPHEVNDAQYIAKLICSSGVAAGVAPSEFGDFKDVWGKSAYPFLTSLIIHLLYKDGTATLRSVYKFLEQYHGNTHGMLTEMASTKHDPRHLCGWLALGIPTPINPFVSSGVAYLRDYPEGEQLNILLTIESSLKKYIEPVSPFTLRDFTFSDFLGAVIPSTLYLQCSPEQSENAYPSFRLLLHTFLRRRISEAHGHSQSLLFVADGFPDLGLFGMSGFSSFIAAYGVSLLLAAESISSIESVYRRGTSPLQDANAIVGFGIRDSKTAEYISQRLERHSIASRNGGSRFRALLTADEILSLSENRMVIFHSGQASATFSLVLKEPLVPDSSQATSNITSGVIAATSEGTVSVDDFGKVTISDGSGAVVGSWESTESAALARAVAALYVSGGLARLSTNHTT